MWWIPLSIVFLFENLGLSAVSGQLDCYDGWTKVLQTGSDGSVVTGSKTTLRDAILNGAELQIYIPGWDYATSTQQVSTFNNSNEICAQAIFHISKDSWQTFRQDAHWYFLLICTTGHIEKSIWYVGSHSRPSSIETSSESTSHLPIVWFVRSDNNRPIYCNSGRGIQTCGSLQDLRNAVIHGADIRIVNSYSSPISMVFMPTEYRLFGEYMWTVSIENTGDHETFKHEANWQFKSYSTSGYLTSANWGIGFHIYTGRTSTQIPMKWFADTCWTLAYKHDNDGNAIDGSLHSLRSAVKDGHRFKIVLTSNDSSVQSVDVDNIVLRSTDVSVQTCFDQVPFSWLCIQLSTSGNESVIFNAHNGKSNVSSINGTFEASWYIDSRHWKHVLTTSEIGIATFGSKSALIQYIRKGSKLRCVIYFSTDHILAAQADNVEISPDGTNIGAQILRVISYTTEGTGSRHFENAFYWRFTIATSEGTISQSEWMVGNHTSRITDSSSVVIDWFVN